MTDGQSKVVPLSPERGGSGANTAVLSAPMSALQDKSRQALLQVLQALFDNADDALFELADRAATNGEQNMYFESMREVRIQRRGMETGFIRQVMADLTALAEGRVLETEAEPEDLEISANNLSLVEHDELEELVAVDTMAAKAEKSFAQPLLELTTRLDSLSSAKQRITLRNNPLGPTRLCQGFMSVCKPLQMDIKAKLVLFKLFDRHVIASLGKVYERANATLIEAGILPRLRAGEQRRQRGSAMTEDPGSYSREAQGASGEDSVFNTLQSLLAQVRGRPAATGGNSVGLVAPGMAPQLPRDSLMDLLAEIQNSQARHFDQQQAAAQRGIDPVQLDIQQVLNRLLTQRLPDRAVSIGQIDEDAINLVSMLFQFILEDRNLATPMKALIARLQIPILKLAMLDKTFFSKGGHPARKLLNEFATAGLGWTPSADLERDPLYRKVDGAIDRLLSEFEADTSIFQDVLADFVSFMEQQRRRAELVEKRTINAEDGKAKSEIARATVQTVLNQKVQGLTLPAAVITLLRDGWSNVLFLICLKDGEDSAAWKNALQTVDDLIWSVQPDDKPESRMRLLKLVPNLLKNLRAGLTKIGFNPYEMNQLFTELERVHLQRLKSGVEDEAAEIETVDVPVLKDPAEPGRTLDDVLNERSKNEAILEELDSMLAGSLDESEGEGAVDGTQSQPAAAAMAADPEASVAAPTTQLAEDDPCVKKIEALRVGTWVEFQQSADKKLRCRLAAIMKATGKYIFVNRAGMKVAERERMELAADLKNEQVALLDDGLLFDRALESVIGNLRSMKS